MASMPQTEAQQVQWARNIVEVVGASPEDYGVPVSLMGEFTQAAATLDAAWEQASNPNTRTRGTVAAKSEALKAMKAVATRLVSAVRAHPGVTEQMLIDAGISVPKGHRTPTPPPEETPVVKAIKVEGRTVTVELGQDTSKRGRPDKVAGALVFTALQAEEPTSKEQWQFATATSKTTVKLPFPPSDTGDKVWITAAWTNAKEESGPAAKAVCVNLPAGGALPLEVNEPPIRLAA